jgi:membrane protein involved in colicin uptake
MTVLCVTPTGSLLLAVTSSHSTGKRREGERKQRIRNQKEELREETTDHEVFINQLR